MNKRKNIVCKNCGAVYYSDEVPLSLKCVCLCDEFFEKSLLEV